MATGRLPDPNSAPVTAKGDLYTYSTVPAKLAVGNNGDTLLADSSQSVGLRWGNNLGFTAGKNAIINGDFRIWQRGTSFSPTSATWTFCSDRYQVYNTFSSGTFTAGQQSFTAGTAPVSGYEGQFFLRLTAATTGTSNVNIKQLVEDVRTFAGRQVTFSFWAKASADRSLDIFIRQNFGSGGSASVDSTPQSFTVTTAWQRFSYTVTLGSMSGKTIGTGSALEIWPATTTNFTSGTTLDFWGWQLETGAIATAFQTATGTLQGELAACQRYYYRINADSANSVFGVGMNAASTSANHMVNFPVSMRVAPTSLEYSTIQVSDFNNYGTDATTAAFGSVSTSKNTCILYISGITGLTANQPSFLRGKTQNTSYVAFSAEL